MDRDFLSNEIVPLITPMLNERLVAARRDLPAPSYHLYCDNDEADENPEPNMSK